MLSRLIFGFLAVSLTATGWAQEPLPNLLDSPLQLDSLSDESDPLSVTAELVSVDSKTAELRVTASLSDGYYIYSMNPGFGGATKISLSDEGALQVDAGGFKPDHAPKSGYDKDLGQTIEKFFGTVTWSVRLTAEQGEIPEDATVSGELKGMYCSTGVSGQCIPIRPARTFTATLTRVDATDQPAQESGTAVSTGAADQSVAASEQQIVPDQIPRGRDSSPISFRVSLSPSQAAVGDEVTLAIEATLEEHWHTYSITQNSDGGGPVATTITLTTTQGVAVGDGEFEASVKPEIDNTLADIGIVAELHHGTVTWTRNLKLTDPAALVEGTISYQICDESSCQPEHEVAFAVGLASASAGSATVDADTNSGGSSRDSGSGDAEDSTGTTPESAKGGLIGFLLIAVGTGLGSLLTPCVFPMIPVTVSFFLKQGEKESGSTFKLAIVYCLTIIGGFTIFGVLLSAIWGPTISIRLANSAPLNLIFAVVFFGFSLMLMGVFELRIPSWLLTYTSKREMAGGLVGVMFMALTFVLVSFTCTFPFVGGLAALAAGGEFFWPIVGMLAYSTAFASPFFLLAFFPSLLKKLPKSGGWMNSVKVTFGMIELALVVKFLSVADIALSETHTPYFLDYTTVMTAWIAIAVVTGFYLLGLFRTSHDMPSEGISAFRCLLATGFVGLGLFLSAGVLGSSDPNGWLWEQIVGFAPPRVASGAAVAHNSTDNSGTHRGLPTVERNAVDSETEPVAKQLAASLSISHDGLRYSLDYDHAVKVAQEHNLPMFLDFTGVNCTNCRQMERTVLSDESIRKTLGKMVRVQLFLDYIPGDVSAEESERLMARNEELSIRIFQGVSMPTYAVVSPDGSVVLSRNASVERSVPVFAEFLNKGLQQWQKVSSTVVAELNRP
jgi:thiol:disulfide interchange protein DsbD